MHLGRDFICARLEGEVVWVLSVVLVNLQWSVQSVSWSSSHDQRIYAPGTVASAVSEAQEQVVGTAAAAVVVEDEDAHTTVAHSEPVDGVPEVCGVPTAGRRRPPLG